ncbi:hypothetical protein [uncultured Roseovarius sp.]|uniref:hypothetical protein n=1 Tax=uncultured Roseovarius sp. TaxID=293344 RepID=UPI00260D0092|nr:hypothetical protein [uncultured Roseovarius sp.]
MNIAAEIETLDNRSYLSHEGITHLSALRSAYHASSTREAEEKAKAEMEAKRRMIAAAKGQFVSVTFAKKDGSERVMCVQPAKLKFHLKGKTASESARKAALTHAKRHPHTSCQVWDADKAAAQSVNLMTISRISVSSPLLGGYDVPETLSYQIDLNCPIGAEVRQSRYLTGTVGAQQDE